MLKSEVKIGSTYRVRLHGVFTNVRLDREAMYGQHGYYATNLSTGRQVRIKSAAKLRREVIANA